MYLDYTAGYNVAYEAQLLEVDRITYIWEYIYDLIPQRCVTIACIAVRFFSPHRLLNSAVVLADVVDDAGDAEGPGEAQQVSQEAECDAEDERSAECFPQRLPDQLWSLGGGE